MINDEHDILIRLGDGTVYPYDSFEPGFQFAFISSGREPFPVALINGTLYHLENAPAPYTLCRSDSESLLSDHPKLRSALLIFERLQSLGQATPGVSL